MLRPVASFVRRHWRKTLVVPPVVVGVLLILVLAGGKAPPVRADGATETARAARIITVPEVALVPRATGFGQVRPQDVWQAVAQVAGRVVAVDDNLKRGAILAAGTEIARIDPSNYDLTVRQREADLKELAVEEENARASIAIQERAVALAERDLARQRDLRRTGAASQSALDQAESALLNAEQTLQNLRNTLNLIPSRRALAEARLEQARLDLENTRITAPFAIRVAEVNVAESQFATVGQVLAEGDGIAVSEIEAQFTFAELLPLMNPGTGDLMRQATRRDSVGEALDIEATVRLETGGTVSRTVSWPARLVRVSDTIDPKTRTAGIILAVEGSYEQAVPGVRPPLVKNMFVAVELRGPAIEGAVVVPRLAVHDGRVYLLDGDDRLVKRPVAIRFYQGDLAVIEDGVRPGDRLVVTDLMPAVAGMLLDPRPDEAVRARLIAEATGEAPAADADTAEEAGR
ncbi:efflux RND transporter periplasmic adaptor subunit [Roseospira navarrensis]|uniref:Efflux RND transporter periplasmic adaptor subunit n=1 Tax=Roseospira navarrensis TaxID=140058 RepID=A0A7X1ZHC7_9PROT|nr:TolC family protein [Roseospira navarrensis]MQX38510.1 efflux RND transporter periplasmic adaptor subunit [Roseospira navarrensis]